VKDFQGFHNRLALWLSEDAAAVTGIEPAIHGLGESLVVSASLNVSVRLRMKLYQAMMFGKSL
jgi:hypothetical protein